MRAGWLRSPHGPAHPGGGFAGTTAATRPKRPQPPRRSKLGAFHDRFDPATARLCDRGRRRGRGRQRRARDRRLPAGCWLRPAVRPLGPQQLEMAAPRELVFDVIAEPYLGRTPRALADKLRVLERGSDMVLAAHFTPVGGGWAWSPRRWRRSASPGPSGSAFGWSAVRCPMSWRRSCSPSSPPVARWPQRPAGSPPTTG